MKVSIKYTEIILKNSEIGLRELERPSYSFLESGQQFANLREVESLKQVAMHFTDCKDEITFALVTFVGETAKAMLNRNILTL